MLMSQTSPHNLRAVLRELLGHHGQQLGMQQAPSGDTLDLSRSELDTLTRLPATLAAWGSGHSIRVLNVSYNCLVDVSAVRGELLPALEGV